MSPRPSRRFAEARPLLRGRALSLEQGGARWGCADLTVRGPHVALRGRAAWLVHAFRHPQLRRSGELSCAGYDVGVALRHPELGYVARELGARASARVRPTLRTSAALLGVSARQVDVVLERLNLRTLGSRRFCELSPLQHRLVGLAHAAVGAPRVWLIEDPFLDLDDEGSARIEAALLDEIGAGSWLWTLEGATHAGRRVLERASWVLDGRGDQLEGPHPPHELPEDGFWLGVSPSAADALAARLREEGADVRHAPRAGTLLVRGASGERLRALARELDAPLRELSPLR